MNKQLPPKIESLYRQRQIWGIVYNGKENRLYRGVHISFIVCVGMVSRGSFTIEEWCERHDVCRASFYNLRKRGEAPEIMLVGNRVRISVASDARWMRDREQAYARRRRPRVPLDEEG